MCYDAFTEQTAPGFLRFKFAEIGPNPQKCVLKTAIKEVDDHGCGDPAKPITLYRYTRVLPPRLGETVLMKKFPRRCRLDMSVFYRCDADDPFNDNGIFTFGIRVHGCGYVQLLWKKERERVRDLLLRVARHYCIPPCVEIELRDTQFFRVVNKFNSDDVLGDVFPKDDYVDEITKDARRLSQSRLGVPSVPQSRQG